MKIEYVKTIRTPNRGYRLVLLASHFESVFEHGLKLWKYGFVMFRVVIDLRGDGTAMKLVSMHTVPMNYHAQTPSVGWETLERALPLVQSDLFNEKLHDAYARLFKQCGFMPPYESIAKLNSNVVSRKTDKKTMRFR